MRRLLTILIVVVRWKVKVSPYHTMHSTVRAVKSDLRRGFVIQLYVEKDLVAPFESQSKYMLLLNMSLTSDDASPISESQFD